MNNILRYTLNFLSFIVFTFHIILDVLVNTEFCIHTHTRTHTHTHTHIYTINLVELKQYSQSFKR